MTHRILVVLIVCIIYLAGTSNLEWRNIALGVMISIGIVLLIRPRPRPMDWHRFPMAMVALAQYVVILAYDLIASGLRTARIVLNPDLPIKPGIIAIPSECNSEMGTALSAHAITLTPGTMVVEIDANGVMYTHCLDVTDADKHIAKAQKLRQKLLKKIFI
jgi:multicomponent Na+:H+ antiporter subunit E